MPVIFAVFLCSEPVDRVTSTLSVAPLQACCGGGGGLHAHQASPRRRGRLVSETPQGGDGPSGGSSGHLRPHGPGHAEVPADHSAAGLPQHGEHPHSPAVLHHAQHDAQSELQPLFSAKWTWDCCTLPLWLYLCSPSPLAVEGFE